jgi:hypothetical protein
MDERNATSAEINQFVTLWTLIRHINFTDQEDGIEWRFKANGQYSTKLAYTIQFAGSFGEHEWNKMWRAKVENKCKFFPWLLLQNKLWTADQTRCHSQSNLSVMSCIPRIGDPHDGPMLVLEAGMDNTIFLAWDRLAASID